MANDIDDAVWRSLDAIRAAHDDLNLQTASVEALKRAAAMTITLPGRIQEIEITGELAGCPVEDLCACGRSLTYGETTCRYCEIIEQGRDTEHQWTAKDIREAMLNSMRPPPETIRIPLTPAPDLHENLAKIARAENLARAALEIRQAHPEQDFEHWTDGDVVAWSRG